MDFGASPVLMVGPRGRGGVAAVVHRQGRALHPRRRVEILAVGRRGNGPLGLRSMARDLCRLVLRCRHRPLVHLHTSVREHCVARDGTLYALARGLGCPVVVQFHGWDRRLVGSVGWVTRALRHSLLQADQLLVVDPALGDVLIRAGVDGERVTAIANPFDPWELPADRRPRGNRVLYLGRLAKGKGLERLIDAFALLRSNRSEAELVLAGDGPLRRTLEARVDSCGLRRSVRFLGWVEGHAKANCFAEASVLALPSDEEAAPLAVVEALAAAVPVVASAVGRIPTLVGPAGVVLDDLRPTTVAGSLAEVLDDPGLGALGPSQVAACHPARVVDELLSVYGTAMAA